ncbi:stage V sporulation protein AC [Paenibacillus sp. ACRRX]|uniref:stage V sporulation protein AC n=1 Tax=unclassified Paenibacillus TaxID=185978 RepID=UPI001EF55AD4|nr:MULTISPECIES: stage V sporulation protein AC [unclassified Paenibacillus]MCG7407910.1 stage V sporulation protein AC [Paenibacillus sp. ACRRX]MDK8181053.1 stage V sporulation protein AC [Paenibacillus sp. UMB4589-SE434]
MATSAKSKSPDWKSGKWTISEQQYKQMAKKREPARSVFKNCIRAFLVGGTICLIGQAIQSLFMTWLHMSEKQAAGPTVVLLIFVSVVLTCLGVYDKIAQWAGAGSAVPVTGFANSMCSAALEHRSEGLVLGVGGNMFKLAGSVIVFGTVAAFVVAMVYLIFGINIQHH